jgi:hypothetical protein
VGGLKDLPHDVHEISTALAQVDGRADGANDRLVEANAQLIVTDATLAALQRTVKEVAERPAPVCPACVCGERPAPTTDPTKTAATASRP